MGLESFKTEGPRTRSKKSSSSAIAEQDVVHVLEGIDEDELDIPESVITHTVKRIEMRTDLLEDTYDDTFVCRDCHSTSQTYEAKLKVDKLDFRDADWYDEFMQRCLKLASEIEDTMTYDEEIDSHYDSDHSDEYDGNDSDGSEDDDEFNSGLSAFTS
jgi:hypothetical protein